MKSLEVDLQTMQEIQTTKHLNVKVVSVMKNNMPTRVEKEEFVLGQDQEAAETSATPGPMIVTINHLFK